MSKKRMGRGLLAAVLALVVGLGAVQAEGIRRLYSEGNRTCYVSAAAIGAGPSAEAIDFADCPNWVAGQATQTVQIVNFTNTKDLLYKLIPQGTAVAAAELTTPAADTPTEVQLLTGSTAGTVTDPPWEGLFRGIIWQSKVAADAITATLRITY